MKIAVLTLDGFNELDSFIAAGILNRMRAKGWEALITTPTPQVTSMNGVTIRGQRGLDFLPEADAVLIGSGIKTRDYATDTGFLGSLQLDPARQLIGAQCSGTLLLAKLGLIGDLPACTDLTTKPWVIEAGVNVIEAPFAAHGNVATAGGCMASQYLAAWMIARMASQADADEAIYYVAPVGEKEHHVELARKAIAAFTSPSEATVNLFQKQADRMSARMNYYKAAPEAMKAMMALEEAVKGLSIAETIRELVKVRVSQINGCAYCLNLHAPEARAVGVTQQKLDVLAAWRESPAFNTKERAALEWAEALTRLETTGAPDSAYEALANAFDEKERVELTLLINTINAWNRFAVGFRSQHPVS